MRLNPNGRRALARFSFFHLRSTILDLRSSLLIFCCGLTPGDFQTAFKRLEEQSRELETAQVDPVAGIGAKKAPPCDEPGFLASQVFAVAAETGWPEERILFMPLARLAEYQHCLLRRNGVRTHWSGGGGGQTSLREQLEALRVQWDGRTEP
ncbi:MAG: hypothetical protein NTW21_21640 [Verrucomicrobia bacterium]|nr:hypothetical protein [Verrucomicrobiota bacterium]